MPRIFPAVCIFFVEMFRQNRANHLIQKTLCHKFITCPFPGKSVDQIVHDRQNRRTVFGEQGMYDDFVLHDIVDVFGTGMVVLHQNLKIEDDAVIDAGVVMRTSAMKRAVRDKDDLAFPVISCLIVQGQLKGSGYNTDDFIMMVPVIRHIIPGTVRSLVIKSDREVKGSLFPLFFVVKIFHYQCPFLAGGFVCPAVI